MYKKMINHVIAVIGVAILIFLSVSSASAPAPDPRQQAQELSFGNEISGDFRAGGVREHWYSFHATEAGRVVVQIFGNGTTSLQVYDYNNDQIANSIIRNVQLGISVEASRTYFFRLASFGEDVLYRISVIDERLQQETIRQERLAQAQELILGREISRNLSIGEEHWYSLHATEAGIVVVQTLGNNTSTNLIVYDSNNREITRNAGSIFGNLNARVVISVEPRMTYLIGLGHESNISRPYSIIAFDEAVEEAGIAEIRRRALANFIIAPLDFNFRLSEYTRADLFDAVAASERLGSVNLLYPLLDPPSRNYVSDVVFVRQDGTDITFRTEDNVISRRMKVDSRTGLTPGQRVRIYYTVYRIRDWQVAAIERL